MTDFVSEAMVARARGDAQGAYQLLVSAVMEQPSDTAWTMLGMSLHEMKRYGSAVAAFSRVKAPDYQGLVNLGFNLHLCGRSEEGEKFLSLSTRLAPPDDPMPWTDLSQCLLRLGGAQVDALAMSREAVSRSADPVHHVALALALFANEQWTEGFTEYEARIPYRTPELLNYPYPRWDGSRVERLFVQAEAGFGDTIWMLRYLPEAIRRVDSVVLYVQAEMVALVREWLGSKIENIVPMPAHLPDADAWCPMMSLPVVLGSNPVGKMYLQPVVKTPRADGFRVGLAWAGSPNNEESGWKDIPLHEFLPLLEMPGIEFHSLQVGRNDIAAYGLHGLIVDRSPGMRDFLDTAVVLDSIDLVICSDSAVAHLAGAMGKPVWLFRNAKAAPWIWPMTGDRSPWYSSMRVMTRARNETWAALMLWARARLRKTMEEKS